MRRVASGEYNTERERCLELSSNPAAKVHAVRNAQLEDLRRENAALLDRLKTLDTAPSDGGAGLVPRASYDRLERERNTAAAAHDKRLLRLKEIFGLKSREFLEAVYSLLGWRIKFEENGAELRLTSMYAPKGKMGLTLKFTSDEGHFGTMAMSGAMKRGLEEAHQFWVVERQSIPGFLAQVTTEMFEKTTVGAAFEVMLTRTDWARGGLRRTWCRVEIEVTVLYKCILANASSLHLAALADADGHLGPDVSYEKRTTAHLLPAPVGTFSILRTVSNPSMTRPNTQCLPSRNSAGAVVMKNWQPFVPGPELAIERSPGPVCLTLKFSSSNCVP